MGVNLSVTIEEARAALHAAAIEADLPTPDEPVVYLRTSDTRREIRWLPPTFSTGEYAAVALVNRNPSLGNVFAVHDWLYAAEGEQHFICEGDLFGTAGSVFEPVYFASLPGTTANWIGGSHNNVLPTTAAIYPITSAGAGASILNDTSVTVKRCRELLVEQNEKILNPSAPPPSEQAQIGTRQVNHKFSGAGMSILTPRTITDSTVTASAIYGMELPLSGCDKMKVAGQTTTIEPNTTQANIDGDNLGPQTLFEFFHSERTAFKAVLSLPRAVPGEAAVGWNDAINWQSYLQRRPSTGILAKLYVLERSRNPATPLLNGSNSSIYQVARV